MKTTEVYLDAISTADGTSKVLSNQFAYKKIYAEEYSYIEINNLPFIRASFNCSTARDNVAEIIRCKKPNLLHEMLTLKESLSDQLFEALEKTQFLVNCLSQSQVNMIIDWCQKNGYPFPVDQKPQRKSKLKELEKIVGNSYYAQFDLLAFLKNLREIFDAFKLYQAIASELTAEDYPIRIMKRQTNSKTPAEQLEFVQLLAKKPNSSEDRNKFIGKCKELFLEKYAERTYTMHLVPDEKRLLVTEVQTENLFDAAFYQLALLLDSPRTQIKQCPICKRYFEPTRTNQKYCATENEYGKPTCYAQLLYKQRHPK